MELLILLEAMNQQMKMLQGVVTMLCAQKEEEPKDPVKVQVLIVINDPRSRELQSKVDRYIGESKKPKAIPYRMVAFKRQKFLQIFNLNSAMYSLDYNLKGYEVKN